MGRSAGIGTAAMVIASLVATTAPLAASATTKRPTAGPVVGIRVSLPNEGSEIFVAGLSGQQRPYAGALSRVRISGTANGGHGSGLTCRLSFSIVTPAAFSRSATGPCPNGRWDELELSVPATDAHAVASIAMVVTGPRGSTVDAGQLVPAPTTGELTAASLVGRMLVGVVGPSSVSSTTYAGAPAFRLGGPIDTLVTRAEPSGAVVASTCTLTLAGVGTHSWPCVPGQGFDPSQYFYVPAMRNSAPLRLTFRVTGALGRRELSLWLLPSGTP